MGSRDSTSDSCGKYLPSVALCVVLLCLVYFLHKRSVELLELGLCKHGSYKTAFIPHGEAARMYAMGFDRVLADFYWLMFVQYYGDREACLRDGYRQAPAYLHLITRLDPHFVQPYWFASFVLASELNLKTEAEELLDYGIRQNPDKWELYYIAGFNQFLYRKSEQRAAHYYKRGAKVKDAPEWLGRQAAILEQRIPSRVKVIRTWRQIYRQATDPLVAERARDTLVALWSQIYWDSPVEAIKHRALEQLKEFGASEPLPRDGLPQREQVPSADLLLDRDL